MNCAWCSLPASAPVLFNNLPYHALCKKEYEDFLDKQKSRYQSLIRRGRLRVIEGGKSGNRTQE